MKLHIFLMMLHIGLRLNTNQIVFYRHMCRYHGWYLAHRKDRFWIER